MCGSPAMTAFSVRSCDSQVSVFAIADEMEKNGTNNALSFEFCVSIVIVKLKGLEPEWSNPDNHTTLAPSQETRWLFVMSVVSS